MAAGTIILRPSADVSLEHSLIPSDTSTHGYLLINEETTDTSTTAIDTNPVNVVDGIVDTATSEFILSATDGLPNPNERIAFTDILIHVCGHNGYSLTDSSTTVALSIDGLEYSPTVVSYPTRISSGGVDVWYSDMISYKQPLEKLNAHIESNGYDQLPRITVKYSTTAGDYTGDSESKVKIYSGPKLSTIWIELVYITDTGLYKKFENSWKMSYYAYIKSNGVWENVLSDECKAYLIDKFVIDKCDYRGYHIEAPLADIQPTCQSVGMTGGLICSFCGKVLKEHDTTIPMIDHIYNEKGYCTVCGTLIPNRIIFTINDATRYAVTDMTWGQWVDSNFNAYGFYVGSDNMIHFSDDVYIVNVYASDVITAGGTYTISGMLVLYNGSVPSLSSGRIYPSATSNSNYALFASGAASNSVPAAVVDAYDQSLTLNNTASLSVARKMAGAASVGEYAIFAGGWIGTSSNSREDNSTVDAYNSSLTRTVATSLSVARAPYAGTATVGNYAIFAGGSLRSGHDNTVDAYNSSLTRTVATSLSYLDYCVGTSIGNYALFIDDTGLGDLIVEAYDASLTRITAPSLSVKGTERRGASVGNYAIFTGGVYETVDSTTILDIADAYDTSLTKITLPNGLGKLSGATTLGNYAIFIYNNNMVRGVYAYSDSLELIDVESFGNVARAGISAASIGNYAILAGGDEYSAGIVPTTYTDAYYITE